MSGDLSASSKNFSEALSRAREIASKIKSGPSSSGVKRTLDSADSEEPDTKKSATTVGDPYLNAAMDGSAPPAAAPAMIGGGPTNEVMMVPDKMVGLIIGRGGEQITRLQAECGAKIQMAPESNGMNERQVRHSLSVDRFLFLNCFNFSALSRDRRLRSPRRRTPFTPSSLRNRAPEAGKEAIREEVSSK